MEGETFRSRLLRLLQKSRQAYRLYTSMGRMPREVESSQYTERQAAEWRSVNAELIRGLSAALEKVAPRDLMLHVLSLRESMLTGFRAGETELNLRQRELVAAAEKGDFVKVALLARTLVASKARVQALQAAHHELENLCLQSHLSAPAIQLSDQQVVGDDSSPRLAQVIPLRKR